MIYKRLLKSSTVIYISKSIIDTIGFDGVLKKYLHNVPDDIEVKGLNMSVYGCPAPFETELGVFVGIEVMTTDDILEDIPDALQDYNVAIFV